MPRAGMQISPEQGQFMRLLIELLGARRAIEVGTFTGYSAICVALALPADGRLVCCEVSEEYAAIAQRYFRDAGVAPKIDLRLAPAAGTLEGLIASGASGTFDFAFIDADKENYDVYYERCLTLLRSGGLLGIDNALWSGRVADESVQDADTVAIRRLNLKACADQRVTASLVPIGDGLLLVRRR
jgi:caffeoyl-CoA O-methyltransferase